jgi:hypothetical protein
MIDTTYAVNCLKQGFQRYIRYNKINATIDCGDNYVSFYVKGVNGKQYLARGSNHHLKMQHLADKDEPWNGDNISVVFITPSSPQDTRIRGRVRQNHYGGIKPFSVTTYQYDNTILNESDLRQIFYAITVFLNGKRYTDPFAKTPKAAKVIPRNANIKPYKEPSPARNISVDKDGNYVSANAWGADYISENKQYKTNTNMNKKLIRLTESDLHRIVKESVKRVLRENKVRTNRRTIKESGHLYGHFDDGTPFTNSKDTWHGVPGTTFISHGEWSDPDVWYDNEEINASELEDYMWAEYQYECQEHGKKPSEQEYDNLPMEWFKEKLDDYMFGKFSDQY